jgi:hypothetical protein
VLSLDASAPPATAPAMAFQMGASRSPSGDEITVDSTSLLRNGQRWIPVMGEIHYARLPESEWHDELLKMKAGGINIASTYVFWIHHEEIEGQWNWSGRRDLRTFVQTCREVGLPVVLRIGPWDHGEVRNGGVPDWLFDKKLKLRSDDPEYMKYVRHLYQQIGEQVKGELWKDGGAVIGVQLENEYHGRGEHLLNLKKLAIECGVDVPLYTRTGWPNLSTPVPEGEILPLFGAYAEGFWDRSLESMPGKYWQAFTFKPQRTESAVATDQLGQRVSKDERDAQRYPYLTCELGGGMMSSYHRRLSIDPMDVLAVTLCKIGSGSNLPGYYMYHGGMNPDSETGITLQESQATRATNYNDLPVKNYDFQAPLGEFGQVRESYHLLRGLHLFLQDFGPRLATMRPVFPTTAPTDGKDVQTMRWCVRTDGRAGFLFVNNYQRGVSMPEKPNVQFSIKLADRGVVLPGSPVSIPANTAFIWPFGIDLGGARLNYATAQLLCTVKVGTATHFLFAQTPGVPSSFVLDPATVEGGSEFDAAGSDQWPGREIRTKNGKRVYVNVLSPQEGCKIWKGNIGEQERVICSSATVVVDGQTLRLQGETVGQLRASMMPPISHERDHLPAPAAPVVATVEPVKPAGPLRKIQMGSQKVAAAPTDADFDDAAIWRIKLPEGTDANRKLLVRIHYVGDVARVDLDGKLIADDFYNGNALNLGLKRFAPEIYTKELLVKVLPLQKGAPIALPKDAVPDFGDHDSVGRLDSVEVVEELQSSFDQIQ